MAASPPEPVPDDRPADCRAFDRLANRVLDRELPPAALDADAHATHCPGCRAARAGVVRLLRRTFPPVLAPTPGFADRVTRAAVADFRRRRMLRRAARVGIGALAASLLVGTWFASPRSPLADRGAFARWWPAGVVRPVPVPEAPPAPDSTPDRQESPDSIRGRFAEAGSAVVSLTRKATDDTLAPALTLFTAPAPSPVRPGRPAGELPEALTELPQAAKAGLEPLTNTAKRAVNLFLRDVGGAAGGGKMKS